jgi:hypothetical protein
MLEIHISFIEDAPVSRCPCQRFLGKETRRTDAHEASTCPSRLLVQPIMWQHSTNHVVVPVSSVGFLPDGDSVTIYVSTGEHGKVVHFRKACSRAGNA